MVGCPVTENDNKQSQPTKKKLPHLEVVKLSNSYSDFMEETFKDMNYSAPFDDEKLPDVVVVNNKDIVGLTNEKWRLLVSICLENKILIIDNPSQEAMVAFGLGVETALGLDEHLQIKYNVTSNSLANLLLQDNLYNAPTDPTDPGYLNPDKSYEAIGIKGLNINFIHNISDMLEKEVEVVIEDESGDKETKKVKVQLDEPEVRKSLASSFADWINGFSTDNSRGIEEAKEYFRSRAELDIDLEKQITAQHFTDTFIATFSVDQTLEYFPSGSDASHRPIKWKNKKNREETIQVDTDVYTACKIDDQKDLYLVKQTVNVKNQELNYEYQKIRGFKEYAPPYGTPIYTTDKINGPYFLSLKLTHSIVDDGEKQHIQTYAPRNGIGSTNITETEGYSIGGNLGLSKSGLSGGLTGNATFSKSKCRTVPDIKLTASSSDNTGVSWSYEAEHPSDSEKKPKACQLNEQLFDFCTLYIIGSDYSCSDNKVCLNNTINIFNGAITNIYKRRNFQTETKNGFIHYIKKPNNAYKTYLFEFDRVSSTETAEEKDFHQKKLNDILGTKGWKERTDIYAVGQDKVNGVAIDCFKDAQEHIEAFKKELESYSFNGTYRFYLKDVDTGTEIYDFENTFDGVPYKD